MNNQKPEIFIHIGSHKTGTTSLQHFLQLNRDLLFKIGILYPVTGIPENSNLEGHHQLAWTLRGNDACPEGDLWHRLKEEIMTAKPAKIVISSEDFYNIGKGIERLKGILEPDNIKIILYLRSYLGYLKSAYSESIKKNLFSGSFQDFIIQRKSKIDYNRKIKIWAAAFGEENIILRLYDKVGSDAGLIRDFCSIIDFDYSRLPDKTEIRKNVSSRDSAVNAIRILNRMDKSFPCFFVKWIGTKRMRKALSNPANGLALREIFLLAIVRKKFYRPSDIEMLRKIVSETDRSILLRMIGEEDIKTLYSGLW